MLHLLTSYIAIPVLSFPVFFPPSFPACTLLPRPPAFVLMLLPFLPYLHDPACPVLSFTVLSFLSSIDLSALSSNVLLPFLALFYPTFSCFFLSPFALLRLSCPFLRCPLHPFLQCTFRPFPSLFYSATQFSWFFSSTSFPTLYCENRVVGINLHSGSVGCRRREIIL